LANQVRLLLHTTAYWLMLTLRDAIPKPLPLASAEFTTLRLRLIKIAARHRDHHAGAYRNRRLVPAGRVVRRHRPLFPACRAGRSGQVPQPPHSANFSRLPNAS
jgi:Transposase DDE domain group 1